MGSAGAVRGGLCTLEGPASEPRSPGVSGQEEVRGAFEGEGASEHRAEGSCAQGSGRQISCWGWGACPGSGESMRVGALFQVRLGASGCRRLGRREVVWIYRRSLVLRWDFPTGPSRSAARLETRGKGGWKCP